MDATISFGKIYIVEWLDPGDAKTGRELHEMLADLLPAQAPKVKLAFNRVETREEFLEYLRSIKDDFRETHLLPWLHVETHGNLYGIGPEAQEPLPWEDFVPELTALNQLTQLRLFFVLAACEGIWAMKMLQPTDRAAFLALLGPNDKISAGKLADAMKLFYRTMFEKSSGGAAFKAINDCVNPDKPAFSMVNAEMLFKMIWQGFLQDRTSPAELDDRVQQIVIQNMIAFRDEHGFPMPSPVLEEVRRRVRRHVDAHEEHFAEFREHYFFIDRFPDNDKRFPITFADLQRDGPPRGGGTLVFDALGVLLHEARKPVTRERVDAAKRFLLEGFEEFTVVGVSLDDEIRRAAARRPWIAELSGRWLALRSNLAACCGRSRRPGK